MHSVRPYISCLTLLQFIPFPNISSVFALFLLTAFSNLPLTLTLLTAMIFDKPFLALLGFVSTATYISTASAFPAYVSLGGLSARQLAEVVPQLQEVTPGTPPGPLAFNGTKLIFDADHPYRAPGPDDIRGPCPGLNTLANHGVRSHTSLP